MAAAKIKGLHSACINRAHPPLMVKFNRVAIDWVVQSAYNQCGCGVGIGVVGGFDAEWEWPQGGG